MDKTYNQIKEGQNIQPNQRRAKHTTQSGHKHGNPCRPGGWYCTTQSKKGKTYNPIKEGQNIQPNQRRAKHTTQSKNGKTYNPIKEGQNIQPNQKWTKQITKSKKDKTYNPIKEGQNIQPSQDTNTATLADQGGGTVICYSKYFQSVQGDSCIPRQ